VEFNSIFAMVGDGKFECIAMGAAGAAGGCKCFSARAASTIAIIVMRNTRIFMIFKISC